MAVARAETVSVKQWPSCMLIVDLHGEEKEKREANFFPFENGFTRFTGENFAPFFHATFIFSFFFAKHETR